MKSYKNLSDDSGVAAYAIGDDSITIKFKEDGTYLYNSVKPGEVHVKEMQRRARAGSGLATYVNIHVRDNYFKKLA